MQLVPKLNRAQVFLVETLQKLHGWHARRKCVYLHCVGGKLEEVLLIHASHQAEFDRRSFYRGGLERGEVVHELRFHSLLQNAGHRITKLEEVWPGEFVWVTYLPERGMAALIVWVSGMLCNQKDFDSREKGFTEDLNLLVTRTRSSNVFDLLLIYPSVHWVIKFKKNKIIF